MIAKDLGSIDEKRAMCEVFFLPAENVDILCSLTRATDVNLLTKRSLAVAPARHRQEFYFLLNLFAVAI